MSVVSNVREVIDLSELRRMQKPKLTGSKITLRIDLDPEEFFQLRELKDRMRCRNWREFIKKILEKREILASDIVAF
jgi:hypothetical protein